MTETGGWWVYILRCADGTFYVGLARHLAARLREHNGDDRRGARYTRGRRPVALFLAHPCADRREAARLEWAVKRLPRERKAALATADGWQTGEDALRIDEREHAGHDGGDAADTPVAGEVVT